VADRAEVAAVEHGHDADAHAPRLLDRQSHRLGTDRDPQAPLGVDHRRPRRLAGDPPAWTRVELAGLVVADIGAEHVRHAVRLDAAQIGHREHVRPLGGILGCQTELLEDLGHGAAQRRLRDHHLVFRGNLEALENHGSLSS